MYYFKNKRKEEERRSTQLNKEYISLRKKEFLKSFAKQKDAFTVSNFRT